MISKLIEPQAEYIYNAMTTVHGSGLWACLKRRYLEWYWKQKLNVMTEGEILDLYYSLTR